MIAFKKVHYQGNSRHKGNPVTYIRFGDQIVFMGMTSNCTSTINAAEEIVNEIAKREGVHPSTVTFYDLQTRQGYSHIRSGDFVIDELVCQIENGVVVGILEWREGHCEYEALRYFQGFISDDYLTRSLKNVGPIQGRFHPILPIRS